jgi:hypothetical protein
MSSRASRLALRLVWFLLAFIFIGGLAAAFTVTYVFNVHGGLLPLRFAPVGLAVEALVVVWVSFRIACSLVPRSGANDDVA